MEQYPIKFNVDYPERLSRAILILRLFFGWIYVGIPHGLCLAGLGVAVFFVQIIAFFAVLFTGKYPRGMFDFVIGYWRWWNRVNGYTSFLTDKYPPFNLNE